MLYGLVFHDSALLEIRNRAEAKRHNEKLLSEYVAAGGDPSTAPHVDPSSVDWLSGKATVVETGEVIQNDEGKDLAAQEYDAEGTTIQVIICQIVIALQSRTGGSISQIAILVLELVIISYRVLHRCVTVLLSKIASAAAAIHVETQSILVIGFMVY